MLLAYNFIINLIYIFLYPIGRIKASKGDPLWTGRLGLIKPVNDCDIWLHAASVGEVRVIGHLIRYMHQKNEKLRLHITTMTRTGFKTAVELYKSDNISVSYFPYDKRSVIKRTLNAINPKILSVAETEIWPNLIIESASKQIPIILINGRMSEKAFGRYKKFRKSFHQLLAKYDRFFFKTEADCQRFGHFNIETEKAIVAGDMKFDAPLQKHDGDKITSIKKDLNIAQEAFVFTAGSTRRGEEVIIADIINKINSQDKRFYCIIAPRHLDRLDEVSSILKDKNLDYRLYDSSESNAKIILVNQYGLLNDLYLISDLSFVGGTLVDIGGHNILEPVWAGCPVLFGPSLSNVIDAADYIISKNYGARVNSKEELLSTMEQVISNKKSFDHKREHNSNDSATARIGEYILNKLSRD